MKSSLVELVTKRARHRCEYCHIPSKVTNLLFEIDHIIAEQHGGSDDSSNLAFACFYCNHHKGPNLAGIDPLTSKRAWLFHPRKEKWSLHFKWNGPVLVGKTSMGRASVKVLAINHPIRVEQRKELMSSGLFRKPNS